MLTRVILPLLSMFVLFCISYAKEVTFQQSDTYSGSSDCWIGIGDNGLLSGNHNDEKLCILNEC